MSETLTTLAKKWREQADEVRRLDGRREMLAYAQACIDHATEVEAALAPPVGTCATCQHSSPGTYGEPTCLHPSMVRGSYGSCSYVVPPQPFGCSLHSPLPPAAPGGEG